jgi:hypothetical protein
MSASRFGESGGGYTQHRDAGRREKAAANTIEGKWTVDFDALLQANPEIQKEIDANPQSREMMKGMVTSMSFDFGKDTMVANTGSKKENVSYKVLSNEGNTMVIESITEGQDKVEKLTLTFDGADKVTMEKDGSRMKLKLTLARSK